MQGKVSLRVLHPLGRLARQLRLEYVDLRLYFTERLAQRAARLSELKRFVFALRAAERQVLVVLQAHELEPGRMELVQQLHVDLVAELDLDLHQLVDQCIHPLLELAQLQLVGTHLLL